VGDQERLERVDEEVRDHLEGKSIIHFIS
jgi:hypothetical protein